MMLKEKLDKTVLSKLKLSAKNDPDLESWKSFLTRHKNPKHEVRIGLIGKYIELPDAYKSIIEGFIHAGAFNEARVRVQYIHSELIADDNVAQKLGDLDGILVAPGFGDRGIEGKITAIKFARENEVPFFGICLGMQMAVIEFARNVIGWKDAHSTEMNPKTKHAVIDLMQGQKNVTKKGGTMRLGSYTCEITKGSKAYSAYEKSKINERHRHRFEFNNNFLKDFEDNGMQITGVNPDTKLAEIVEIKNHPYFVGVQFHPEYKSTVLNPHPLFVKFVKAAVQFSQS
jgi:CTP synthase